MVNLDRWIHGGASDCQKPRHVVLPAANERPDSVFRVYKQRGLDDAPLELDGAVPIPGMSVVRRALDVHLQELRFGIYYLWFMVYGLWFMV